MGADLFEVHGGLITRSAVEPFWVMEGFDMVKDRRTGLLVGVKGFVMEPA
jgi:hypothetical protein